MNNRCSKCGSMEEYPAMYHRDHDSTFDFRLCSDCELKLWKNFIKTPTVTEVIMERMSR